MDELKQIRLILNSAFSKDVSKAFGIIKSILVSTSKLKNDFLLLENRYNITLGEYNKGILSWNQYSRSMSQIANTFLYQINQIDLDDIDLFAAQYIISGKKGDPKVNTTKQRSTYSNLKGSSKQEVYDIIDLYKSNLSKGTLDDELFFSLGLCYLYLKLYDLASRNFEKALELCPDNAEYYYYLGLVAIKGRRPYTLMPNEVRFVEKFVNSAIELNRKQGKYHLLSFLIKFDYYFLNGLSVPDPSIQEILDGLKSTILDPGEIQRLKDSVIISDSRLIQFFKQF